MGSYNQVYGSEDKGIILSPLKLEIERRMERLVLDAKQYEEIQYEYRDRVDTVALECFCKNCNFFFLLTD